MALPMSAMASLGVWQTYAKGGDLAMERRDYAQAEKLYALSLDAVGGAKVGNYPQGISSLLKLAGAQQEQGKFAGLEQAYQSAIKLTNERGLAEAATNGLLLKNYGRYHQLTGNQAMAKAYYLQALDNLAKAPEDAQTLTASVLVWLSEMSLAQHKVDEAAQWLDKAIKRVDTNRGDFMTSMILVWEHVLLFSLDHGREAMLAESLNRLMAYKAVVARPGEPVDCVRARIEAEVAELHGRWGLAASFYDKAWQQWSALYGAADAGTQALRQHLSAARMGRA
jgi:tetratricopeptide (TPR) repeat protein